MICLLRDVFTFEFVHSGSVGAWESSDARCINFMFFNLSVTVKLPCFVGGGGLGVAGATGLLGGCFGGWEADLVFMTSFYFDEVVPESEAAKRLTEASAVCGQDDNFVIQALQANANDDDYKCLKR